LTYALTGAFPVEERYGLTSQMRRASLSIPSNVAEGHGVVMPRWSLRYIIIAIASSLELETQLEASLRLKYVARERTQELADPIDGVQKLLYGMRRGRMRRIGMKVAGATMMLLAMYQTVA